MSKREWLWTVAIFAAVLAAGMISKAFAQEAVYMPQERDDLEIRASSEGHFAEIAYVNEVSQISNSGRFVLMWEGEAIVVDIEVRSGPEIIRITPPDDLMAVPDYAEVPDDGIAFVIQIMRPMF
jgi:hypothetical protein